MKEHTCRKTVWAATNCQGKLGKVSKRTYHSDKSGRWVRVPQEWGKQQEGHPKKSNSLWKYMDSQGVFNPKSSRTWDRTGRLGEACKRQNKTSRFIFISKQWGITARFQLKDEYNQIFYFRKTTLISSSNLSSPLLWESKHQLEVCYQIRPENMGEIKWSIFRR